ncbi:MAG: nucleotidyltransferase domain-containing protein [Synergistaceae bacterium]|nr:nucleotidyltransferase domain-containing protein [Synergistaceae bacterium]
MPVVTPVRLKRTRRKDLDEIRERSLEVFLERLRKQEGDNLIRVILFGSVARGDARDNSDTDVLVLVKEGEGLELLDRIVEISVEVDLEVGEYKTHLSPLAYGLQEFNEKQNVVPLFWNIGKDGVVLYDAETELV